MDTLKASNLLKMAAEADSYSHNLKVKIQMVFRTNKINRYEYEHMINLLTCSLLLTKNIKNDLEKYITDESNSQMRIDIRI